MIIFHFQKTTNEINTRNEMQDTNVDKEMNFLQRTRQQSSWRLRGVLRDPTGQRRARFTFSFNIFHDKLVTEHIPKDNIYWERYSIYFLYEVYSLLCTLVRKNTSMK